MELQSLVYNTTTRAPGTGRRRKSWLPFSCFCFYVFVLQHAFAFTPILSEKGLSASNQVYMEEFGDTGDWSSNAVVAKGAH
jgi:hypothetical protein